MGNAESNLAAVEAPPLSPRTFERVSSDPLGDYQHQQLQFMKDIKDKPVLVLDDVQPKVPYSQLIEFLDDPISTKPAILDTVIELLEQFGFLVITDLDEHIGEVIEEIFDAFKRFCAEPEDTKAAAASGRYLGYAHKPGVFETFQLKLNDDPEFKWPTTVPGFKDKATSYFRLLDNTARLILRCIAGAYSSDQEDTSEFFIQMMDKVAVEPGEYSSSTLRMFRYYNPTDQPQPDVTHIDIALGALIPACEIPGLQIFNKSLDSWIDVERTCRPLKDLIFFPGDVIELCTNGFIAGTIHRVMRLPGKERYSLPYAIQPNPQSVLQYVPTMKVADDEQLDLNVLNLKYGTWQEDQFRRRTIFMSMELMENASPPPSSTDESESDVQTANHGSQVASSSTTTTVVSPLVTGDG